MKYYWNAQTGVFQARPRDERARAALHRRGRLLYLRCAAESSRRPSHAARDPARRQTSGAGGEGGQLQEAGGFSTRRRSPRHHGTPK